MSQPTSGPWIYYADVPSADPNWHIVTTANKMRVLANIHIEPGNQMDKANADLISAAPELLAVLKASLRAFRCTQNPEQYPDDHWCNLAIGLIAKIEGAAP